MDNNWSFPRLIYESLKFNEHVSENALPLIELLFKRHAVQQGVQLTALRCGLAVSIFINLFLLVVVLSTIGGN